MIQESTDSNITLLKVHELNQIPKITTVRGIARHVGTTSVVANLALLLAERGAKVLALDLSLWNSDLTLSLGHTPDLALVDLADSFDASGHLSLNSIASRTRTCKLNLDLLPGSQLWLASPSLRAENGWNFIKTLLISAREHWDTIVADLGAHSSSTNTRENIFFAQCAIHAALLQTAHSIVGVCDSIEYPRLWQELNGNTTTLKQTIFVVNHHHKEFPLGLDQFKLDKVMRAQSYFIPPVKRGLIAKRDQLFFVERFTKVMQASSNERQALQAIQNLAERVHR